MMITFSAAAKDSSLLAHIFPYYGLLKELKEIESTGIKWTDISEFLPPQPGSEVYGLWLVSIILALVGRLSDKVTGLRGGVWKGRRQKVLPTVFFDEAEHAYL